MALEQLQHPITQVDLDAIMAHKGRDDYSVFYIHSNCHSSSPTWTRYESGGFLRVECSECLKTIAIVKVAEAGNRPARGSMALGNRPCARGFRLRCQPHHKRGSQHHVERAKLTALRHWRKALLD